MIRNSSPKEHQLGLNLLEQGKFEDAEANFRRAIEAAPKLAQSHHGLGDSLHAQGKLSDAIAAYRQAVALDPGLTDAWWGLGCALAAQQEHALAAESFQALVKLTPNSGEVHQNLGKELFELGQIDEALEAFRNAAARLDEPEMPLGMIASLTPGSPRADPRSILEARRQWAAKCGGAGPAKKLSRQPDTAARKLRIGYVCFFFQDRNWMKPVWGLVNHHDRDQFEIHLFSDGPIPPAGQGYKDNPGDYFHDISRLTNSQLAKVIEDSGIDILVDLNGYSRLSRLPLFALRPAPVQVSWFIMYATTGMDCFDCLIGDRHVIADGDEAYFSERLVRLPGCYLTFEVSYPVPEVTPAPCLERGSITFGCLAPQYKITTECMQTWSRILQSSPGSQLILKNRAFASSANRQWVLDQFSRFGIPPERLELDGPAEHYEFLKKYAEIDVTLDTFPYNGGTTTMESLWQGVPVVTFYGDRWASRISASLLRNGGLPEFVAADLEGYVQLAVKIGCDPTSPAQLGRLRQCMRDRLRQSQTCDASALARDIEREYLRMWQTRP
jgi:predicted O-linked N-acetylglucosamine transferase (SPINDLY family)